MTPPEANAKQGGLSSCARWLLVLACIALAAGGGFSIWHGLGEWSNAEGADWPAAAATIVRARVKTVEPRTKHQPGTPLRNESFEVVVDYTFTVEGRTFSASGPAPQQVVEDEGQTAAQAIADALIPGSTLPVYYLPQNPTQNRLRRVEVSSSEWLRFVVLGSVGLVGSLVGMWWVAFRCRECGE